jgi:hypothetical protein
MCSVKSCCQEPQVLKGRGPVSWVEQYAAQDICLRTSISACVYSQRIVWPLVRRNQSGLNWPSKNDEGLDLVECISPNGILDVFQNVCSLPSLEVPRISFLHRSLWHGARDGWKSIGRLAMNLQPASVRRCLHLRSVHSLRVTIFPLLVMGICGRGWRSGLLRIGRDSLRPSISRQTGGWTSLSQSLLRNTQACLESFELLILRGDGLLSGDLSAAIRSICIMTPWVTLTDAATDLHTFVRSPLRALPKTLEPQSHRLHRVFRPPCHYRCRRRYADRRKMRVQWYFPVGVHISGRLHHHGATDIRLWPIIRFPLSIFVGHLDMM